MENCDRRNQSAEKIGNFVWQLQLRRAARRSAHSKTAYELTRHSPAPFFGVKRITAKKRAGSESLPGQLSGFYILRQLSTHCGSNGDDGGGNKPGAHRTSSMKVPHNNHHSTDMVERIHTANSRILNPDIRHTPPEIPPQFRPKPERQNAAWERKSINL